MKKSIKEYLIEKNYSNAEILIRSGQVKINNEVVFTPSFLIKDSDKILIEQKKNLFLVVLINCSPLLKLLN